MERELPTTTSPASVTPHQDRLHLELGAEMTLHPLSGSCRSILPHRKRNAELHAGSELHTRENMVQLYRFLFGFGFCFKTGSHLVSIPGFACKLLCRPGCL